MVDGSLSQEEIDLLLQGADDFGGAAPAESGQAVSAENLGQDMSPIERESIADLILQALNAGTQGVGMMISRNVRMGQPYAETRPQAALEGELGSGHVAFIQNVTGAVSGAIGMFMPMPDAIRIAAIPMGNEDSVDTAGELDSAQIATVRELIGPMLSNISSQMSARMGAPVNPMPLDVKICNGVEPFPMTTGGNYLKIQIPFVIENSIDSRLSITIPMDMANLMYNAAQSRQQTSLSTDGGMGQTMQQPTGPLPGQSALQNVGFPSLSSHGTGPLQPNMNLLMDVQMTMTVELGRTKMYIKDILGLGEGSIIELDKLAGEPVDLLVNSKLIAKGEVVVIDENFGVRVTDIVSPIERLKTSS